MADLTPLWISLKIAIISTMIVVILSVMLAKWLYNKQNIWARWIESFIFLPIILPPTVLGFLLLIVFSTEGPLGHILTDCLGIQIVFSLVGATIASIIVSFPLMYQHAVQGFRSIDGDMLNAARTMGASERKIFMKLILPLSKRALISGAMLAFARAIGEFGATLMVAGYIPGRTNTLPLEIYFLVQQGRENQAWLWVLVLVAFSITIIGTMNILNKDAYKERD